MDVFFAARENFGLVINTEKTVVMHQPPPNTATPHNAPQISVNGTQLQVVENFPYLCSTHFRSTKIEDEVVRRISKARQAFGRLLESSRSSAQYETEDVQGRHPPDVAVLSKDLDGIHESGMQT
ncbi:hypothetical protein SprV_0200571000 [Sparganum proliferum]